MNEELSKALARLEHCHWLMRNLVDDLPRKRDWLDQDLERAIKEEINGNDW